ncbi:MAG: hypothetical protein JAY65_09995, partial [Candidatus Thiodiazotropha endolucinida]|nr:hypothetical protein [Candidatus Thiodiazotropha taylori]MCW4279350.1 hypothetical protein [Candidatus Thiodiazotropha taylori]
MFPSPSHRPNPSHLFKKTPNNPSDSPKTTSAPDSTLDLTMDKSNYKFIDFAFKEASKLDDFVFTKPTISKKGRIYNRNKRISLLSNTPLLSGSTTERKSINAVDRETRKNMIMSIDKAYRIANMPNVSNRMLTELKVAEKVTNYYEAEQYKKKKEKIRNDSAIHDKPHVVAPLDATIENLSGMAKHTMRSFPSMWMNEAFSDLTRNHMTAGKNVRNLNSLLNYEHVNDSRTRTELYRTVLKAQQAEQTFAYKIRARLNNSQSDIKTKYEPKWTKDTRPKDRLDELKILSSEQVSKIANDFYAEELNIDKQYKQHLAKRTEFQMKILKAGVDATLARFHTLRDTMVHRLSKKLVSPRQNSEKADAHEISVTESPLKLSTSPSPVVPDPVKQPRASGSHTESPLKRAASPSPAPPDPAKQPRASGSHTVSPLKRAASPSPAPPDPAKQPQAPGLQQHPVPPKKPRMVSLLPSDLSSMQPQTRQTPELVSLLQSGPEGLVSTLKSVLGNPTVDISGLVSTMTSVLGNPTSAGSVDNSGLQQHPVPQNQPPPVNLLPSDPSGLLSTLTSVLGNPTSAGSVDNSGLQQNPFPQNQPPPVNLLPSDPSGLLSTLTSILGDPTSAGSVDNSGLQPPQFPQNSPPPVNLL